MTLITDPDDLNQATEVVYDTAAKTIQWLEAGNMSSDGATIKSGYSFTVEEYKTDAALISYDFPFNPITDEFFEIGIDPSGNASGWTWADALTRNLQRRGGWIQYNAAGLQTEHWAGISILGAEADDQCYYDIGDGATDFVYIGNTAEAVQVRSDPNGDGNYVDGFDRSANLTAYNRQQGQIYSSASTSVNGEANLLAPKLFGLTLATGDDLNVVETDVNIDANAPYTGMSITFATTPQARTIAGVSRNFGVIIDANGGTLEEVYEYERRVLRLGTDIDAGASGVVGKLADEMLRFVGGAGDGAGSLVTLTVTNAEGGGTGVYIDNIQAADVNRVTYTDNTGTPRAELRKASLILEPNGVLQADATSEYWVYFADPDETVNANEFDSAGALLVPLDGGGDMTGSVTGAASIPLLYDFDGDTTGGRTPGQPVNVVVVAVGTGGAKYVRSTGQIVFPSAAIALPSGVERQYENAA